MAGHVCLTVPAESEIVMVWGRRGYLDTACSAAGLAAAVTTDMARPRRHGREAKEVI